MPKWYMGKPFRGVKELLMLVKPLLMEPRKSIIEILSSGVKSTNEVYTELLRRGIELPRTTLYYHLSALEEEGIIEMVGYREPEKGSIPEKTWRLRVRKVGINIVTGEICKE